MGIRRRFGLIGRNISYSFSRKYFTEKFRELDLKDHEYVNFDLETIGEFKDKVLSELPILSGCNVTIPYKEQIIPFLEELDPVAKEIGAVNTIKVENDRLIGFNTDSYGFEKSLRPHLGDHHTKALILGTGGASKAVAYVLDQLGIESAYVSRSKKRSEDFEYQELTDMIIKEHLLIVNCSPVGTFPDINEKPKILYEGIGKQHVLYDLIYNPEVTAFLKEGMNRGATTQNGLEMLQFQADRAWEIWNS